MIHATAILHPKAQVDPTVRVGPYAVIDAGVTLGAHCDVGPHVYLTGQTTIGTHNRFHAGCVIGNIPQDLKYRGAPSRLRVGDHNCFREGVTVNCANDLDEDTTIGSHNLFMACSHVAHNCHVGDRVILVNGALLAGHVTVGDRAVISGNALVHQFVRVGTLAMMQGGTGISKDLPPYTVAWGVNRICGLNSVGVRRAGLTVEERLELKALYHRLFRSGLTLRRGLEAARSEFTSPVARVLIEFITASKRGVCADRRERGTCEDSD